MFIAQLNLVSLVLAVGTVDAGDYVSLMQHRVDRVAAPVSLAAAGSRMFNTRERAARTVKPAPHPIWNYLQFEFAYATNPVNNLGGQGPDTDSSAEVMKLKNVTIYKDMSINMIIEAITPYKGNVSKNGLEGDFFQINIDANTSTDFKATFVDDATGLPVMLPDFTLSVWDVDNGKGGQSGIENVTFGPIIAYYVTRDTEIRGIELERSYMSFTGSTHGKTNDNPHNLTVLLPDHLSKGLELEMSSTSELYFSLDVSPNKHGRTFLIGGYSKLSDVGVRHHVGVCQEQAEMTFADPLGVLQDEGGLRFGSALRVGNQDVDVLVSFDDAYQAFDFSKNGIFGSNLMVNLADNTTSDVTFTFIDPHTNKSMLVENFAFSIFDIDGTLSGYEQVAIRNSADMHYYVLTNTTVNVTEADGKLIFRSTVFGDFADNPDMDLGLTTEQIEKTVLLWFDEPISSVTLTLTTYKIWTGRDFEFGMASRVLCPLRFHYEPENPCDDTRTRLKFDEVELASNDLTGDGIRLTEVGFARSTRIDLIITADSSYRAFNESKNGVSGGLLNLNVADGVKTTIKFQFVEHGTDTPFAIKKFFLTILDIDGTRVGHERIGIRNSDFTTYFRHAETKVQADETESHTMFKSDSFGTELDNPVDRDEIGEEDDKRSVALYFKKPTDKVQFTLEAENAWTGRNFQFTGKTDLACAI